jgi:hypothetical protein
VSGAALHEHALGLSWVVVSEGLQRASHALVVDGGVWLIDPVADEAALSRVAALGSPAAVVRLLDRHGRDGDALAASLRVPLHDLPPALPGTPFEVVEVIDAPGWHERALWWPERRALVVAELVGTSPHYTLSRRRRAGMHPMARPFAPGALRALEPEHLLVGHGAPLHGADAAAGLREAHARARADLPRLVPAVPALLGAARGRWG